MNVICFSQATVTTIIKVRWICLESSDVTFLSDSVYQKLLKLDYFSPSFFKDQGVIAFLKHDVCVFVFAYLYYTFMTAIWQNKISK